MGDGQAAPSLPAALQDKPREVERDLPCYVPNLELEGHAVLVAEMIKGDAEPRRTNMRTHKPCAERRNHSAAAAGFAAPARRVSSAQRGIRAASAPEH